MKTGKAKQATADMLTNISDDCNNVLDLIQAVTVKSKKIIAAPLYLRTDKRACVWFRRWTYVNLPTPPKPAPQDHMGLTSVLTDMATWLHIAEALRLVTAAKREVENETKGWYRLPPTAQ